MFEISLCNNSAEAVQPRPFAVFVMLLVFIIRKKYLDFQNSPYAYYSVLVIQQIILRDCIFSSTGATLIVTTYLRA